MEHTCWYINKVVIPITYWLQVGEIQVWFSGNEWDSSGTLINLEKTHVILVHAFCKLRWLNVEKQDLGN